jgi:PKD repeat protein/subtilisin family serine protease
MKKSVLLAVSTLLVLFCFALAWSIDDAGISAVDSKPLLQNLPPVTYVPDEVSIKIRADRKNVVQKDIDGKLYFADAALKTTADNFRMIDLTQHFPGSRPEFINGHLSDLSVFYLAKIQSGSLDDAIAALKQNPNIELVEPIPIMPVYATPNDGFYPQQWHLNRANDADIDAPAAWDIETGDATVVVAILDTGVRYYHKDLGGSNSGSTNPAGTDGNMWINWAEKNGTAGVDDDGDGYVDDWVGWDWVTGVTGCWSGEDCSTADNDPRDFNGHGTHCAGNVGAINNNAYATCAASGGWNPGSQTPTGNGVKVMALRIGWSGSYLGQEVGYVNMSFAASAFNYARIKGAKIASCSWGSSSLTAFNTAVTDFINAGGIICVAAGNSNNQTADYLNARTDHNIISVAATDSNDCKASFSSYGTWVDISSPGTGIMSLYHNHADAANDYVAAMDGTSMATPITASVMALVWSKNLTWTATQVVDTVLASADNIYGLGCNSSYAGKLGAGRINAYNAVLRGGTPCPIVADFTGTPTSGCAPLTVQFTDASAGGATTWSWTFGDGGTSNLKNPSHQYTSAGTYTVTLIAGNGTCNNTKTRTDYITVNATPVAAFVGSPTSGYIPLTVNFTDQSTGGPTAWAWTFGDGGTSNLQNPSHQYTNAGTYTVTLTASNACGSNQLVKTNYITASTPPAQQCDDFADADISNWGDKLGTWTATGGYMKGNSNTTNARTTSPFGTFTNPQITCDVRMNTGRNQRNARILFAFTSTSNYRIIEFDDLNNYVRFRDVVSGSLTTRKSVAYSFASATWYNVTVTCASDGNVSVMVGTTSIGSYKWASAVNGKIGCGFTKSNSDFDNFCVSNSGLVADVSDSRPIAAKMDPIPNGFDLGQNYPNPFNPVTTIEMTLPVASDWSITIYNITGEKVADFSGYSEAGRVTVNWDASRFASGVYFYKGSAGIYSATKKMVLLK